MSCVFHKQALGWVGLKISQEEQQHFSMKLKDSKHGQISSQLWILLDNF